MHVEIRVSANHLYALRTRLRASSDAELARLLRLYRGDVTTRQEVEDEQTDRRRRRTGSKK